MNVSISKLKCFKGCRRAYELKYIEGLYPVNKSEALETGTKYHALLEELNTEHHAWPYVEHTKEMAMAQAYYKYIYPKFYCQAVEESFEYDLGDGNKLIGRIDARADGGYLVEHKTTGLTSLEAYEYNLQWDEQIPAYMLATGARKMYYTICRKPTIRQKQNESEEEFYERMLAWYDEDTDSKIRLLEIERTDEEILTFEEELKQMVHELEHTKHFYRNTQQCNMFGSRCEYSSVCLHYDKDCDYVEFERREEYGQSNTTEI